MKISKGRILVTWWALLFYVVVLSGSAEAYALCFEADGHIAIELHQNCRCTCLVRLTPFNNSYYSLSIVDLSSSKEHCSPCKDIPVENITGRAYLPAREFPYQKKSVVHSSFSYNVLAFGEMATQGLSLMQPLAANSPLSPFRTIILLI